MARGAGEEPVDAEGDVEDAEGDGFDRAAEGAVAHGGTDCMLGGTSMPDAYRDALEAAQARIDQLERENDALKKLQGARPATVAELEAVRLENELRTADMMLEDSVRRDYGVSTNPRALARTKTIASAIAVVLFAASAVWFALGKAPAGGIALAALAFVGGVAIWGSAKAVEGRVAAHKKKHEKLARDLAKMRGMSGPRVEEPRLRAPEAGAEDEVEEPAARDEGRRAGRR